MDLLLLMRKLRVIVKEMDRHLWGLAKTMQERYYDAACSMIGSRPQSEHDDVLRKFYCRQKYHVYTHEKIGSTNTYSKSGNFYIFRIVRATIISFFRVPA
jgi:hypothetical protein